LARGNTEGQYTDFESHYYTVLIVSVTITVFNATFNNISAISWRLVLLVDVEKNTDHLTLVTDKLSHYVLPSTPHNYVFSK
jgi:hypothetical protein